MRRVPASEATGKTLRADYPTRDDLTLALPGLILRHNLHGIDIDPPLAQIAALALWMRASGHSTTSASSATGGLRFARRTSSSPSRCRASQKCSTASSVRSGKTGSNRSSARRLEIPEPQRVRATKAMADSLCGLVKAVWDAMTLAGEAGSLLKIEEALATAIEGGRDEWEEKLPLSA